ncbi:GntR family transcriptional regulator [Pseudonocardia asaccharolytica]|uniref:GntR family transcriptional regulator n=1 Tax=Pseudonocardia asaccharolytica DSM 44247 = NBRC 16224 TaxID=1123024 RepID=A0A511D1P8_9PSEU|nr:GntR family transcriptional regulator [Pseudonocardia asaccharolytica]GEL18712.1 GntR family transcriptional regulator [Pseudonocardia asaccharolytica DSM 44247 = NBRC 16224]
MVLKPIGRGGTSLADEAYRRISGAMLRGDLQPGSRLVMDALAERLDISRTPVRDALHRLEREGLVESAGRKGYIVRAVADDDLAHLYESRLAIEVYAATRVAELGAAATRHVEDAVIAAVEKGAADAAEAFAVNRMVHRAVVEATGNPLLVELFDDVWNRARALQIFEQFHRLAADGADQLREHHELVRALRAGPEQAAAAMRAHIGEGLQAHHEH